jgi:hypothetical protein
MQESTGSTTEKLARRFFHLPCLAASLMLATTFHGIPPLTKQFDPAKFMAAKQIVVDSSFTPEMRFQIDSLPQGYAVTTVRQRRGGKQTIYF